MAINENAVTDTLTPTTGTLTVAGTESVQNINITGTGENLLQGSNSFTNTSYWTPSLATVTGSQTDPFGGTTASYYTPTGQYGNVGSNASYNFSSGVTYTFSIWSYVASGTRTISLYTPTGLGLGSFTATTTWTRYSITFTSSFSGSISLQLQDRNASGFVSVYIYGAQLEIGSVANTYVPTTTTAVYGTPTLNFSGVSSIGLQNDGSLYVSPAGTGALQAQQTTSSITGGNARGANAVDWQTSRAQANQVASGQVSFVGGGFGNKATGYASSVVGGYANTESNQGFVGGGSTNSQSGTYSAIVGGATNTIGSNAYCSVIGSGYQNNVQGYFSSVLGGTINSTTSGSSVTTQSATMNGTTAVTLSGSNGAIKVGQLVTGTYIPFPNCYVAAISGTSLTLSVAATGSGTATLTFYTPHGIVVGGGNNQATGSYSFIGGGGDAGTASQRNTASGDWSFVGGGAKNVASGPGSVVVGGGLNSSGYPTLGSTASGLNSAVVNGTGNNASGSYSLIAGSVLSTANANFSGVIGGTAGTTRSIQGNLVFPCHTDGVFSQAVGVAQAGLLILVAGTTDATATVLTSTGSAASGTNQIILPNNSAYYVSGFIVAGVTGAGNTASWTFQGAIKRGSGVGTTAIVGSGITAVSVAADAGASTWAVSITADTTNGGLAVTVTGQAATTIRWVCKVETTEMTY